MLGEETDNCWEYDISYNHPANTEVGEVQASGPADCQEKCLELSGCQHFTFSPNTSTCTRISGGAKVFKVGLVSGRGNCSEVVEEPRDCYDVGVGYNYGDYLNYFTADDPRACQVETVPAST